MPLQWTIAHEDRLVVAVATGTITLADMEAYFADLARSGALPYGKIFDITFFDGSTVREVGAAAARMVEYGQSGPVGPLAIVASGELGEEIGRLFSSKARLNRPVGIFADQAAARAWVQAGAGRNEPSVA
ncbi:MAG TPA: STAS/SEC14 domain-containing protein [Reyranellaceae bacterium]|nr:STAS/SEC14 domain-containing protein [Reyranellaceae bacterium]